jgi:hypothetical protein
VAGDKGSAPGRIIGAAGRRSEAEAAVSQQQTIAYYRITGKLGEGGVGAVYRATDTKLDSDVVVG